MVEAIHSGGQDGADIAGLDAGKALGMRTGGWVPQGPYPGTGRTDRGHLTALQIEHYNLRIHPSSSYPPRTELNVTETDGTVIFGHPTSPGCSLTVRLCKKHKKPCLIMEALAYDPAELRKWVLEQGIHVLNVAGNREWTNKGIYDITYTVLLAALERS